MQFRPINVMHSSDSDPSEWIAVQVAAHAICAFCIGQYCFETKLLNNVSENAYGFHFTIISFAVRSSKHVEI